MSAVILAIGHSARDTFELLQCKNIFLEPKPFSVGARIEHKQAAVDESLYGDHAGNPLLPKGEYQLSWRDKNGRGVYTFVCVQAVQLCRQLLKAEALSQMA